MWEHVVCKIFPSKLYIVNHYKSQTGGSKTRSCMRAPAKYSRGVESLGQRLRVKSRRLVAEHCIIIIQALLCQLPDSIIIIHCI